ncbi:hypothetical protein DPEC_G00234570 [Dallia pectoralis]|uniref:Uncharacterized protein n=1 Tax=Dallia pectoralis TaxID=75939 RepID=A0ACC2FY22_DALPE|nr:hypothetical protein DPEC_G00234570 [Dallia pectoralis]
MNMEKVLRRRRRPSTVCVVFSQRSRPTQSPKPDSILMPGKKMRTDQCGGAENHAGCIEHHNVHIGTRRGESSDNRSQSASVIPRQWAHAHGKTTKEARN